MRLEKLQQIVADLCSPECAGRETGSKESENARAVITTALDAIGLEPAGEHRYLQHVPVSRGANVLASIEGRGRYQDRIVLVAAHYDHLGRAREGVYQGADDNAAAVAILLDTAKQLAARRDALGRRIIFAFFDGEEPPHFLTDGMGSVHFVKHPTVPIAAIDMMICMDLMGHALGPPGLPDDVRRSVFALGAEKSQGTGGLVDAVAKHARGVKLRRLGTDVIPTMSDYAAFEAAGVPYLFLTCGRYAHYHRVTDTPEKLDYPKMLAAADVLAELVLECSTRAVDRVEFSAGARDDAATLRSLAAIATEIAPSMLPELEKLDRERVSAGALGFASRQRISIMVATIEAALSG